jgi:signal transduction histidine kinase
VYVASHDLRAPLTGISTVAQWILEDDQALSPESRAHVALIQARARRMSQLLSDIHAYARAGRLAEVSGPVSTAAALVTEIAAALHVPVGFQVQVDQSLAAYQVARIPLEQILHNLISNAIKHHDRKSGKVKVSAALRGLWLRFSVIDDGPGIDECYRDTVFEMFKTLKPRDQVEGSGMGLALVRKIVTRMGGTCGIDAAGERGTHVWFDWPATAPAGGMAP